MLLSRFGLVLLLLSLVLVGFGCKKPQPRSDIRRTFAQTNLRLPTLPTPPPPRYQPKDKEDRQSAPEVAIVRQAIQNLAQSDSFRATLILPGADGKARGEMEFSREKGMHAALSFPGAPSAEFYLRNNQLVFKTGTSSWQDISFSEEGGQIRQLFQHAFNDQKSTSTPFIFKNARFVSVKDDKNRGCKMYEFTQYSLEGEKEKKRACIKDSLPIYVSTPLADGELETTYRDFNQKIEVTFPNP